MRKRAEKSVTIRQVSNGFVVTTENYDFSEPSNRRRVGGGYDDSCVREELVFEDFHELMEGDDGLKDFFVGKRTEEKK